MTTTKRILVAAGGAGVTFALILFACHTHLATKGLPSGFGLIPFYLLVPAELLGETLSSRAAFLITGFLEFFLLWWLGLLGWGWRHRRKQV